MTKYFRNAFATGGDRDPVPDLAAGTLVNYEKGYTPEYELDPDVDPSGNYVGRRRMNQLFNDITGNLKFWQENGVPEIVANDGTGNPLSYKKGFTGTYLGVVYRALIDDTTTLPPSAEWVVYDLQNELDKLLKITDLAATTGDSEVTSMTQKAVTKAIGAVQYFTKPTKRTPLFEKKSATEIKIPAGFSCSVGSSAVLLELDLSLSLDTNLDSGTKVAGTDYFVYLKDDGTAYISASDTETDGRLIGGFHYGLTGHAEATSGNKTEADMVKLRGINAHSFWDLTFRANKKTNRGLSFVPGAGWVDIYLADEDYAIRGWSKAGGWIAGGEQTIGRKFPKIPEMFGGNGSITYGKLTPFVAMDMANAAEMDMISYQQFAKLAYGVEEGLSSTGIEAATGKIEHYPRLTSKYGIEQATGVQYTWSADFGSSSIGAWESVADGRGQVYSGVQVVRLGGDRGDSAGNSGSRCSNWNDGLTDSYWDHGLRGCCGSLVLD